MHIYVSHSFVPSGTGDAFGVGQLFVKRSSGAEDTYDFAFNCDCLIDIGDAVSIRPGPLPIGEFTELKVRLRY